MANQSINTEIVISTADKLHSINNNINSALDTLRMSGMQLENHWNSTAGSSAATVWHRILKYNTQRSGAIRGYIDILRNQINPDYMKTEKINSGLASKFM